MESGIGRSMLLCNVVHSTSGQFLGESGSIACGMSLARLPIFSDIFPFSFLLSSPSIVHPLLARGGVRVTEKQKESNGFSDAASESSGLWAVRQFSSCDHYRLHDL
ncbi:hypothetical protein NPIL_255441 [Nephila pilipes]|uniref:Uncharacterized protein n=1 Tax=Nephila pilipes TaxID=299642 RepID=A0A8X6TH26_NEPPI|nr:hypothetical protein NPIL_255441 [Nephila pilipes]